MSDSLTVFGVDYTGVTGIKAKGTGNGMLAYIRPQGTKSISANGTYDVSNLASLVVALDFVTYYTSSSNPTSSQGSNGDIWLVTS